MKASNASSAAALVSAIQISCNARLAFGCWLFGNLAITFAVLCTQHAAQTFSARPHRRPSRTRVRHRRWRAAAARRARAASARQQIAPVLRALAGAIGEADQ